ncbi:MAG TPA: rod shape-determining protein MreD [Haliangiales bacterium]|nr:rod shape-determining protein MreD [Haliangiales bacterium]
MRVAVHVLLAFLWTVLLGALWRLTPFELAAPDVALLYALFLGASSRGKVWEATLGAIVIGYLADVVGGAPPGLGAFVLGLLCVLVRMLSSRLLLRGALLTAVLSFVAAAAAGVATWAIRAAGGVGVGPLSRELAVALGSALLTAFLSPIVFRASRGVDARFARTQREREALREGYLL